MESPGTKYESINKLKKLIEEIDIAMLTTVDEKGDMRSRPMATIEMDKDGFLWFFTSEHTGKVKEVNENHKVNVNYAHPGKSTYVALGGVATSVKDRNKIKELWSPILKAWFPNGPEDPQIILLKVSPDRAEYWDSTSNKMVQLFEMAKAIVTGETYKEGDHGQLNIK